MEVRLVIKGTYAEAYAAAKARNIIPEANAIVSFDNVYCDVHCENLERIAQWYSESVETPFPNGTLLYYTIIKH